MRFVSIDIETTGLNPEYCQILQVGAVIEDTVNIKPYDSLPTFSCIVEHERYTGQPFALNMNNWIFSILSKLENTSKEERLAIRSKYNIIPEALVASAFSVWLLENGIEKNTNAAFSSKLLINVAGKNFAGFDKLFLQKLPNWSSTIQIKQRILDPAILLMDWQNDDSLPNLNTCLNRLNLEGEVTHNAAIDALDVIRVIRTGTNNYTRIINNNK